MASILSRPQCVNVYSGGGTGTSLQRQEVFYVQKRTQSKPQKTDVP